MRRIDEPHDQGRRGRPGRSSIRVLVLATSYEMPYRVMRCFWEAGATVFVLGARGTKESARRLRWSRCCSRYVHVPFADLTGEGFSDLVNRVVERHGIDMVAPTDQVTTRVLIENQAYLNCRTFPIPHDVATFDRLNQKTAFATLCRELGIRHPSVVSCTDRASAVRALARLRMPQVVKPEAGSGGAGVYKVAHASDPQLRHVDYSPILLQDFVEGRDECMSAFCAEGSIEASVAYRVRDGSVEFFDAPDLRELVKIVVERVEYNGVVNFDARRDPDGTAHLIECNPRFWFNMDFAMLAGLNFAELGMAPRSRSGELRVREQEIERIAGMMRRRSMGPYLRYLAGDPVLTGSMTLEEIYRARIAPAVRARLAEKSPSRAFSN